MNLPLPPMTESADSKNGEDIRKYLFRLVEILNNSSGVSTGAETASVAKPSEDSVATLKSLVIKNSKDTAREMDGLRTTIIHHGESITNVSESVELIGTSVTELSEDFETFKVSIADYITEEGSSDNWKWRKWKNGKAEAWYNSGEIGEVELTPGDEGIYTSDDIDGVELMLPEEVFAEAPTFCSINVLSELHAISQISEATDTTVTYRIWRSYDGMGTMTINDIQIYCFGTWIEPPEPEPEPEPDPEE